MNLRLADLFTAGQEGRQAARDDQTRKGLASYFQGDQGAIGQVYQNAPEVAFKAEGMVDERRAAAEDRFGKLSTAFAQSKDPTVYAQWRQVAQGVLGPQAAAMPESLDDPADLDGALKTATALAQAYGQGVKQAEPRIVAPGSALVDNDGRLIYERPFAPQGFKGTWDSARAMWIPQPGTEGSYGGPTSNPITGTDFGIGETNDYVRKILGKVQIDPNAPPEQQAEALLPHLIQQESGGDPNAVSPKGAQGLTQVMPATGRDPGFGVSPLRDGSPQENVRFGRDYLTAMLKRYPGRPDLALAAYNAGPGVADRFAGPQASRGGLAGIPVAGVLPKAEGGPSAPAGYRWGATGNLEFIPGGPADPASRSQSRGAPTEGERKAATLLSRLDFSLRQLEQSVKENPDSASPNLGAEVVRNIPLIGGPAANAITPASRQRVEAAQLDILDAALTLGTGAAYTKEQLEGYRRSYFPQIGDSEDTIADKSERLNNVVSAARIAAGRAAPDAAPPKEAAGSTGGWSIKVKP